MSDRRERSCLPRILVARSNPASHSFPDDIKQVVRELSPRVIQFSGHGDAVRRGALAGALAFELSDGTIQLPNPDDFIDFLRRDVCPQLECVYLNGCHTLSPLGACIQQELPHLTVIGWESLAADKAASAFSRGFYDALAHAVASDAPVSISSAYQAAAAAFEEAGFTWGDPQILGHGKAHGAFGSACTRGEQTRARSRASAPPFPKGPACLSSVHCC